MESEEVKAFAEEVYRQCIGKGMTCEDFGLFTRILSVRRESVTSDLYHQSLKLPMPNRQTQPSMTEDEFNRLSKKCLKSQEKIKF